MEEQFKIFVDRLRNGTAEQLDREFSPDFIALEEDDISFSSPVFLRGEAYLTDDSLVLQLDIETKVTLPCSICNQSVEGKISISGLYQVVPFDEIGGGVYELKEFLRENIILEIPSFIECNQGSCSQRKDVEKYMRSNPASSDEAEEVYHPFKDL